MNDKLLILVFLCLFPTLLNGQNDWNNFIESGEQRYRSGELKESVEQFKKALLFADSIPELNKRIKPLKYINSIYNQLGMYDSAIYYNLQYIETARQLENDTLLGFSYFNQGLNYKSLSNYEQTKGYYSKALKIFEKINLSEKIAIVYNSLGNLDRENGRLKSSINYHKKAIEIKVALNSPYELSKSYHNIGRTYIDSGLYDLARFFLYKSVEIKNEVGESSAKSNNQIGVSYMKEEKWDSAYIYLNKSLSQRRQEGNNSKLLTSYKALGELNLKLENISIARAYLDSAYNIAQATKLYDELYEVIQLQITTEKHKNPASYIIDKYDELLQLDELISRRENQRNLMALNLEYNIIEYEKTIEKQIHKIRIDQAEKKALKLKNLLLSASVITIILIILIIIYFVYRLRKSKRETESKNRALEKSNKRIENLHEELSHRTKNYYEMFRSIFRYDRKYLKDANMKRLMDSYINRVEAMSQIQRYLLEKEVKSDEVQLDLYLSNLLQNIENALNSANRPVKITQEFETIRCDYDNAVRLALVMNEVMINAFEHGFQGIKNPSIRVTLYENNNEILHLKISDNGVGIRNVAEFEQSSRGIGLMQMILESNNGTINYENKNDKGTIVIITLPKYLK